MCCKFKANVVYNISYSMYISYDIIIKRNLHISAVRDLCGQMIQYFLGI